MIGAVSADKENLLLDQLSGFALRDEFGRLDSVYEQLQLRQLKASCDKVVSNQGSVLTPNNVQTIAFQCFEICVQGLAVRGESLLLEPRGDLSDG